MLKKIIWANFQRIIELYPKNGHQVLKYMGLGSEIRDAGSGKFGPINKEL
jgi:hypothetical protein